MTTVSIGTFRHWRVTNDTHEVHPFHIHQVHFLVYAQNGVRLERPEWLDTVNVPVEGNVDLMMDFTDPIIRGISLFQCHLLSHEEKCCSLLAGCTSLRKQTGRGWQIECRNQEHWIRPPMDQFRQLARWPSLKVGWTVSP
jgi:Multicopper oxidase